MMLDAVIFDFDGVLADSEPLHLRVYQEVLAEQGLSLDGPTYYDTYLGYDDVAAFRRMSETMGLRVDGGRLEQLVTRKTAIFQAMARNGDVLFPGAATCLRAMAAACPIAVASGALRHEIELILGAAGLLDLVPVIVAAGETPRGKPAPDPFALALERLAAHVARPLRPRRSVGIEDSHWGLESARGAGLVTVALTTSYPAGSLAADLVLSGIDQVTPAGLDALVARRGRVETEA
jgi:HAD superfamily hydrolase (TIGR01509 family)